MNADDLDEQAMPAGSRLSTVLVFLAAFAMIVSWLGVFAFTNALIAAEVITGWPRDTDPRSQWMAKSFVGLYLLFAMIGLVFRWTSRRQLRRIDAIADA